MTLWAPADPLVSSIKNATDSGTVSFLVFSHLNYSFLEQTCVIRILLDALKLTA